MGINIFTGCGSVSTESTELSTVVLGPSGVGLVTSVVSVRCTVGFDVTACAGSSWITFWFLTTLVVGVGN